MISYTFTNLLLHGAETCIDRNFQDSLWPFCKIFKYNQYTIKVVLLICAHFENFDLRNIPEFGKFHKEKRYFELHIVLSYFTH